jgi:uncharacterized protein (TIGR00369 family)
MSTLHDVLAGLRQLNRTASFNEWCGFEVVSAEPGSVVLGMSWKAELGQYSGYLHAGVIGALIDTACGYAAVTLVGPRVLASHFSVSCLRPAVGERFEAHARVVKPGRTQVFTACELHAFKAQRGTLVATGETLLSVFAEAAA